MTIAYKVVRASRFHPRKVSVFADGQAQVIYYEGVISRPKVAGSKLFAFRDLGSARDWLYTKLAWWINDYEIWECEVTQAQPIMSVLAKFGATTWLPDIEKFWQQISENEDILESTADFPYCAAAPWGSLACDSLKLIRKIKL